MAFVFLEWFTSLNMITTSCIQIPARNITVFLRLKNFHCIYNATFSLSIPLMLDT